jgi:predicted nucleic acid-binding protein
MSKNILTDTGFWIAFFDNRKDRAKHDKALLIMEDIKNFNIILPWPIMYEVLRTRFVRNKPWCDHFNRILKSLKINYLNDIEYREQALLKTMELCSIGKRSISLVDIVIRFMLMDKNIKVDYLTTFNCDDFYDICKNRRIPIYYQA